MDNALARQRAAGFSAVETAVGHFWRMEKGMSEFAVTGDAKTDHATAARGIIRMFESQCDHARALGQIAWGMGLKFADNPFEIGSQQILSDAWIHGMQAAQKKAQGVEMRQDPCPWPVVYDAGQCCGDQPCTIKWRRPCDAHGGCLDRSTCNGCDAPEYANKLHALAMKYQEAAATAGQKIFRMQTALTIIREWSMKNWNAGAILVIRDWIDAGMSGPLPWPGGAFFEEWAEKEGYSNVDGCVGLRFRAQLIQDDRMTTN